MILRPWLRKCVLAIHLSCSVGWLGAVVAYVALDLTVATSDTAYVARAAWISMALVASYAIVPLAFGALLTGVAMGLGTKWGLFRHWWVLTSLLLTVLAILVLLSEAGVISRSAAVAAATTGWAELRSLPPTLPHSVGGLLVVLVIQVMNVYKPAGLTPYGWRKQQEERTRRERGAPTSRTPGR